MLKLSAEVCMSDPTQIHYAMTALVESIWGFDTNTLGDER